MSNVPGEALLPPQIIGFCEPTLRKSRPTIFLLTPWVSTRSALSCGIFVRRIVGQHQSLGVQPLHKSPPQQVRQASCQKLWLHDSVAPTKPGKCFLGELLASGTLLDVRNCFVCQGRYGRVRHQHHGGNIPTEAKLQLSVNPYLHRSHFLDTLLTLPKLFHMKDCASKTSDNIKSFRHVGTSNVRKNSSLTFQQLG